MPDPIKVLRFFSHMEAMKTENKYCGTLLKEVPMSDFCSFRIGGRAAMFARPTDLSSFCLLLREARVADIPVILIGMGSNVLLPDGEFPGLLVTTRDLQKVEINGTKVTAECGAALNTLILRCAAADLGGLALLYGIPATVGGAAFMNAGAHGVAIGDRISSVEVYDVARDEHFSMEAQELAFSYRKSALQKREGTVITRVHLTLIPTEEDVVRARVREVIHRRAKTQPVALPSAGSAFLRPCESSEVWRLVDACGLRGFRIGGAAVSEQHAGFIVNCGGATAADVRALMAHIQSAVYARHGLNLVPEIRIFE